MTIDFNAIVLFQLFVIIQGISTAIVTFRTVNQHKQNLWLGLLIVGLTCQTADSFFISSGLYRDYHQLYFLPLFFSWSYGSLSYFYIQSAGNKRFKFKYECLIHFLPALIQFVFYFFISIQNLDFKTWFWFNVHKPYTRYIDVYVGIILLYGYFYFSLRFLPILNKEIKRFATGFGIFLFIAAVDPFINESYLPEFWPKFYIIQYVLPFFTFWLVLISHVINNIVKKKELKHAVVDENHLRIIVACVEQNRFYLNPDFTLSDLAAAVSLNTNTVSNTLNSGLSQTFNDFINNFRIEAIKTQLLAGEHLKKTLLGIALDCGFNSKNTFNRAFKKSTGSSPSEWISTHYRL